MYLFFFLSLLSPFQASTYAILTYFHHLTLLATKFEIGDQDIIATMQTILSLFYFGKKYVHAEDSYTKMEKKVFSVNSTVQQILVW